MMSLGSLFRPTVTNSNAKPEVIGYSKNTKPKVFKEYQQIQLQAFKSDAQYAAEFWTGERLMDETIAIQRTLEKRIVSGFRHEDRGIRNAIFLDWDKGADKVRLMFVSGIVDPGLSPKVDTTSHPMMSKVTDIKIERNRLVVYGPDEYGSPIAYSFAIVKDPKPIAVPETKPATVKKDKPKTQKSAPSREVVFEVRQGKKVLADFPTKEEAIEYGTQEAQKGNAVCVVGVFR